MNDEGEMEALTNSDWAKLGIGEFPLLNPLTLQYPPPLPLAGSITKTTLDELERNFLSAIVSTTDLLMSSQNNCQEALR